MISGALEQGLFSKFHGRITSSCGFFSGNPKDLIGSLNIANTVADIAFDCTYCAARRKHRTHRSCSTVQISIHHLQLTGPQGYWHVQHSNGSIRCRLSSGTAVRQ
jgi:hypothetical protein